MNGDQISHLDIYYDTGGWGLFMREWSVMALLQATDTEIGPSFTIPSIVNQKDTSGDTLAYRDKIAVVTGAASGIGLATGKKLLSQG